MSKNILFTSSKAKLPKEWYHPILARNAERGKHHRFWEEPGFYVDEDLVNSALAPPSFSVEQENPVEYRTSPTRESRKTGSWSRRLPRPPQGSMSDPPTSTQETLTRKGHSSPERMVHAARRIACAFTSSHLSWSGVLAAVCACSMDKRETEEEERRKKTNQRCGNNNVPGSNQRAQTRQCRSQHTELRAPIVGLRPPTAYPSAQC